MDPKMVIYGLAVFLTGIQVGKFLCRKESTWSRSRSSQKQRADSPVELYVGNLSYDVSERDLARAFENFGKVSSARIIKNGFSGKSKGFGFVQMIDRSQMEAAIRALDGKELKERKIVVNEARSRA